MAKIANKVTGSGFVRFEFADGEFLQCTLADVKSADIVEHLALHGLSQKVGDAYAGAESVTDARLAATAVWGNLVAGLWATKATRGGKIVEALHRATKKPLEDCQERYAAMSDGDKKELRKHPAIKIALAEIETERAAALAEATTDGDDLSALFD